MLWQHGLVWGIVGGLLSELLYWYGSVKQGKLSDKQAQQFRSIFYWLIVSGMILAGGLLVVMYILSSPDVSFTPILAVNVGASAPLTISALMKPVPPIPQGSSDSDNEDNN